MSSEPSGSTAWKTVMLTWSIQPHGLRRSLEKHFHSTQSTAASRNVTWSCITQGGSHISALCCNTAQFSGHQLISDGQKDSGHVFCGQRSPRFSCFWEKLTSASTRMRKSIQAVIRERFKASVCHGMGLHQCPWHGWLHVAWMLRMREICYHPGDASFLGVCGYFNKTMPDFTSEWISTFFDLYSFGNLWEILAKETFSKQPLCSSAFSQDFSSMTRPDFCLRVWLVLF